MRYEKLTTKELKQAIRHPYAWPGGYELVAVTDDGAILCMNCCRENWKLICASMRSKDNWSDGWRVVALTMEAVGAEDCREDGNEELISYCDNCYREFGEFG